MDNIVNNIYSSNSFSSSAYLLGKNGEIYKGINPKTELGTQRSVIEDFSSEVIAGNDTGPRHFYQIPWRKQIHTVIGKTGG